MNPIRQLIHFAAIGVVNTGIDAVLYFALTRLLGATPLAASAISFLAGSLNSFLLNKRWTFADPAGGSAMLQQYVKFLLVTLAVMSVHQASLLLVHHQLGIPDLVAKGLGIALGMAVGFRLNKRWVFRLNLPASRRFITFAEGA